MRLARPEPSGAGRGHPCGFRGSSIKGIIASIGGDDAIRLIPHIDLNVIADNPKVFLGYSDPTVLHFGCLKAGLGSFYGPTIMAGFAENGGMHAYAENLAAQGRLRDGAHRRDRAECGGVDRRASALGRSGEPEPPPRS